MPIGPIIVSLAFFATIAGIWIFAMFTRHRERMALLEKGLKAEDVRALYERDRRRFIVTPLSSLKWGIIFVSVGIAVLLGMYLHANYSIEEGVYPGLIFLFGGLGLVLFYLVARRKTTPQE